MRKDWSWKKAALVTIASFCMSSCTNDHELHNCVQELNTTNTIFMEHGDVSLCRDRYKRTEALNAKEREKYGSNTEDIDVQIGNAYTLMKDPLVQAHPDKNLSEDDKKAARGRALSPPDTIQIRINKFSI